MQLDAAGEGKGDGESTENEIHRLISALVLPFIHLSNKTKEANTER